MLIDDLLCVFPAKGFLMSFFFFSASELFGMNRLNAIDEGNADFRCGDRSE